MSDETVSHNTERATDLCIDAVNASIVFHASGSRYIGELTRGANFAIDMELCLLAKSHVTIENAVLS